MKRCIGNAGKTAIPIVSIAPGRNYFKLKVL